MSINEIFSNPTVKNIIFQIKFPNLFYIENKIGDIQYKIMKYFPKSSLLIRRQLLFADIGAGGKIESIPGNLEENTGKKIWQFKSNKDVELNIMSDSLDISSTHHITYSLEGADKFRDTIELVLNKFFEVVSVPIINRIGLRYIDECPIPSKDNKQFNSYYNTAFPLSRFSLDVAKEMIFKTVVKKDNCFLRYIESLQTNKDKTVLILDFDGFTTDIEAKDCLEVTDNLHKIISDEYEKTIKEPVYEYMRKNRMDQ